jgi:peptidoglycan L-alanyl-D-glutamate endopeptidase CwlK
MGYKLGTRSLKRLVGVHPDLVKVVKRAIEISEQDFSVGEGLRSEARQFDLYNRGKSTTMNSRHLTGHAVDLFPYPFNGDVDEDGIPNIEDWDQYYPIADAMKQAARELGVDLEWGGAWHISPLHSWGGSAKSATEDYVKLRQSQGRKPFLDGPHFQLSWENYPK